MTRLKAVDGIMKLLADVHPVNDHLHKNLAHHQQVMRAVTNKTLRLISSPNKQMQRDPVGSPLFE